MTLAPIAGRARGALSAAALVSMLALALACGGAEESETPAPEAESGGAPAAEPAPEPPAAEPEGEAPAARSSAEEPASGGISEAAREEAERIFSTRCTTCHGPEGRGDGPASQGLDPQPRNFHRAEWQESVTDEHIEQIIMYGGAAVGKSAAMPANPDLTGRPEVVEALRAHIRGLGED